MRRDYTGTLLALGYSHGMLRFYAMCYLVCLPLMEITHFKKPIIAVISSYIIISTIIYGVQFGLEIKDIKNRATSRSWARIANNWMLLFFIGHLTIILIIISIWDIYYLASNGLKVQRFHNLSETGIAALMEDLSSKFLLNSLLLIGTIMFIRDLLRKGYVLIQRKMGRHLSFFVTSELKLVPTREDSADLMDYDSLFDGSEDGTWDPARTNLRNVLKLSNAVFWAEFDLFVLSSLLMSGVFLTLNEFSSSKSMIAILWIIYGMFPLLGISYFFLAFHEFRALKRMDEVQSGDQEATEADVELSKFGSFCVAWTKLFSALCFVITCAAILWACSDTLWTLIDDRRDQRMFLHLATIAVVGTLLLSHIRCVFMPAMRFPLVSVFMKEFTQVPFSCIEDLEVFDATPY
eukprot:TRINITY_DN8594_c0_g1_i1.p1 TRINITY_DN8594_c0_g1~~TRINITY_DN8594_c0_g1_i1.p1  ORF type:complete len:424 (-),score=64.97 TRINITY_DN8594_c0_g1_i1:52-1269(-)